MTVIELWWLTLAIAALVIAVVAVLLGLIIRTARQINEHAGHIWTVGKQIAGNTVAIWTLDQTNEKLTQISQTTRSLADTTITINERLQALTHDVTGSGGRI